MFRLPAMTVIKEWIEARNVQRVEGALRSSAYIARAYKQTRKNNGVTPDWAKKENGQWLFDSEYIKADAKLNLETIGIHEAAEMLGAARRTIQTWVDNGEIQATKDETGRRRRILKEPFMRDIARFRERLETAPVVAFKIKHGTPVPQDVKNRWETQQREKQLEQEEKKKRRGPLAGIRILFKTESQRIAEFIEARLQKAKRKKMRQEHSRPLPETAVQTVIEEAAKLKEKKSRTAETIEKQLHTAKEKQVRENEHEKRAVAIAKRIADQLSDGKIDRVDAAIAFNDVATREGIPYDIQVRVMKEYFKKQAGP